MHTGPKRVVGALVPSSHAVHADAQYPPGDASDAGMHSSPGAHVRVSLHAPPRMLVGGGASGTGATSGIAASTGGAICTAGGGGAPEHAATIAAVNMKQRCTVLQ